MLADWQVWARDDQLPPSTSANGGDWRVWLILGGRGAGKTRTGAEWVKAKALGLGPVARAPARRIALVGETYADVRRVMIEGESGLLAIHSDAERPRFEVSKGALVWPNGAVAQVFSAESPDALRGPQFEAAWCDELCKWRNAEAAWDTLQFALRLGEVPQVAVTTTPKPIGLLKAMLADPLTVTSRASTAANAGNLAPTFLAEMTRRYAGSLLGRQELDGELIEDMTGGLWRRDWIEERRVVERPELRTIVVAVDPPVTSTAASDACGIVVAGLGHDGRGYASREGQLTDEQFQRLKEELEAGFQGARGAGRPMLLEGGLDWRPLSLSPKDMDFVEAKNTAAREIALALGVPPMLLGIPGDNTYSNYQEASRSLWRQTVLPLVARTAKAMSMWLAPAWGGGLELRPDLDAIEALSSERDQLWARLEKASFLDRDEKRWAAGYGASPGGGGAGLAAKYNRDQPRVPAGNSDGGQWSDGSGGGGAVLSDATPDNDWLPGSRLAQVRDPPRRIVSVGGRSYHATEAEATQLAIALNRSEGARARLRPLDSNWQPVPQLSAPQTASGAITSYIALAQQAEARLLVIERGGLPLGFNSREDFTAFGLALRRGLAPSGQSGAEVFLRGSAVTGYSYRTGEAFDLGRQSDIDVAIVSPVLLRELSARGLRLTAGGARTLPFGRDRLPALRLPNLPGVWSSGARDVTYMIYRSRSDVEIRGPHVQID